MNQEELEIFIYEMSQSDFEAFKKASEEWEAPLFDAQVGCIKIIRCREEKEVKK